LSSNAISLLSATGFDFSSSNNRVSKISNPPFVQGVFDHILNKIFSQIHVVIQIIEASGSIIQNSAR
jgi:hypothetical protein